MPHRRPEQSQPYRRPEQRQPQRLLRPQRLPMRSRLNLDFTTVQFSSRV
jgi:hypothetical protein